MDYRSQMPLARFRALLDTYGAKPDRWPPDERDAARELLAKSPEAERWRQASSQLDAILDLAPVGATSPALIGRILAATPERSSAEIATAGPRAPGRASARGSRRATRFARGWRYVGAALPLAAAAALVLWLLAGQSRSPERTNVTLAEIGTYDAPTDVLLAVPNAETLDSVPSFGCTGSGLGRVELMPPNNQSALDIERYV